MKLNKQEYQALVDSRLVELENAIKDFKNNEPIANDHTNLKGVSRIVYIAEAFEEAYENMISAEEDQVIEEYKLNLVDDLEETLSIRKGEAE